MSAISELRARFTATADGFRDSINDISRGMDDVGERGEQGADRADRGFGKLKSTLLGFGAAFVGFEALKGLGSMVLDAENASSKLQMATGATNEEMKELDKTMKNIYASNLGEDFNDVADSLTFVKNATGLTGEALEKATSNALLLRETYEFDVTESIKTAETMAKQFGITHDQAMELIAQGAQKGLDKHGDMLDSFNEYSVYFKTLGFDAEGMFNILAEGSANGAFNLDKVGDAVKEFGIRVKDQSESTQGAFQALGLDVGETEKAFAKGGETAQKAFSEVMKKLSEIEDPIEKNTIGVALFGTQFEDLEAEAIVALGNVGNSADMNGDTLKKMNEIKYDNLGDALQGIGRSLQVAVLEPIQKHVLPALGQFATWVRDNMPQIQAFIGGVFGALGVAFEVAIAAIKPMTTIIGGVISAMREFEPLLPIITGIGAALTVLYATQKAGAAATALASNATKVWTGVQAAFNAVMALNPITMVIALIVGLVAAIVVAYKRSEEFRDIVNSAWEAIKNGVGAVIEWFATAIPEFINGVVEWFGKMRDGIVDAFTAVIDWIKDLGQWFTDLKQTIADAFSNIVNAVKEKFNEFIQNATDFVQGIITKFEEMKEKSSGIIKVMMEYVGNTIKNALELVKGIFTLFVGVFTGDTEKMKEGISKIWTALKDQVTNIFTALKDGVMAIFEAYKTLLINGWTALSDKVKQVMTALKDTIIKLWTALKDGVNQIFTTLKQLVTTIAEGIKTAVVNTWNALSNSVKTIANALKDGVVNAFNTLKSTATTIVNTIKSTISSTFTSAKDAAVGAIKGLYNGVVSWFNNVISKANELKTNIVNAFKSISLVEVGKDIVRGLWNGISSMGGWIKDLVGGFVDGLVTKAKNVLGIRSPSRVFMEVGEFVSEGMAIGITANEDMAQESAESMARAVVEGGTPSGSGGGYSNAGYQLFDVQGLLTGLADLINGQAPLVAVENMNVRNEQDMNDVSRKLKSLIDQSKRSQGIR